MRRLLPILLFFLTGSSYSQDSLQSKSEVNQLLSESKYLSFLYYSTEKSQNHLLTVNHQFMKSWGKTLGAQCTVSNFGLNLARLFSRKFILGVTADIKIIPGVMPNYPSRELASDLEAGWRQHYDTPLDSANAEVLHSVFTEGNFLGHDIFSYGVMFSPFPQRFGGLLFQVKYGATDYFIHSHIYGNPYVNNGGSDKYPMTVSENWIYEITIKPSAFFENSYVNQDDGETWEFRKFIVISFYYERVNFRSAEFNGTKLADMVSPAFMDKYGLDERYGIKIGLAFY